LRSRRSAFEKKKHLDPVVEGRGSLVGCFVGGMATKVGEKPGPSHQASREKIFGSGAKGKRDVPNPLGGEKRKQGCREKKNENTSSSLTEKKISYAKQMGTASDGREKEAL